MKKQVSINDSVTHADEETGNFFFLKSQAKTAGNLFVGFESKWIQDLKDPSKNNKVRVCMISCYDQKRGYVNFEIPLEKLHEMEVLISETQYLINGKTSLELIIYPIGDAYY